MAGSVAGLRHDGKQRLPAKEHRVLCQQWLIPRTHGADLIMTGYILRRQHANHAGVSPDRIQPHVCNTRMGAAAQAQCNMHGPLWQRHVIHIPGVSRYVQMCAFVPEGGGRRSRW